MLGRIRDLKDKKYIINTLTPDCQFPKFYKSKLDMLKLNMKKYYPQYSIPTDPINTISIKIQSYMDKKKFMTENYLMKELMNVFSTQTSTNKITFTASQGAATHTWKTMTDETALDIYEDFKNIDVITREQFEALKLKEGTKTSKEIREYDKYFKLSVTDSFENLNQELYGKILQSEQKIDRILRTKRVINHVGRLIKNGDNVLFDEISEESEGIEYGNVFK
jgi:hypothetical protein